MSHWLSITPTGVEERLPIKTAPMRLMPVWKLSMLYYLGEGTDKERETEEAGEEAQSAYFKQHRKLMSC